MNYLQWLSGQTDSIWWHDSANMGEAERALTWGAQGMTTNPFLVNQTLRSAAENWELSTTGLAGDQKALHAIKTVTTTYAQKLQPIREKGVVGQGYVCAQTNPNKCGDFTYMVEQAKVLSSWAPNIVVKLPATRAGIRAYEECAALGINVAATVSFTVSQVLAVGEAAKRGKERAKGAGVAPPLTIAVLMVGRLDDYLRDVVQDRELAITEEDIRQAGTACIKGAYALFQERGYDTFLMPAGCRGAYHISALAGAKMIMSISPKIQEELVSLGEDQFVTRIDDPIDPATLERLLTLDEFERAYRADGMQIEEFIIFGSTNRTIDQFINSGWNPLTALEM
jgi:transaldolase